MTRGGDDQDWDEERLVRPYAVTGGRTRVQGQDIPIEALVCPTALASGAALKSHGVALERTKILQLCEERVLSLAELSASLRLPLGVVRVLVSDLANEKLVTASVTRTQALAAATNIDLLESVLNGIAAL